MIIIMMIIDYDHMIKMIIMMMIKSMTIDLDQRRWTSWQSAEKQSHHLALTFLLDGDNVDYHYFHYY